MTAAVAVSLLGSAATAAAHPVSSSAVLLDVDAQRVTATVELPLDQLGVARCQQLTAESVLTTRNLPPLRSYLQSHMSAADSTGRAWTTAVTGGRVEKIDGVDNLILDATLTPSSGAVGDFVLRYDAVMDELISHRAFITARYGHTGAYTTLAMLSWQRQTVPVAATSPQQQQGFVDAVGLGIHHIAGGSDHLLFLLMLLLPAPLIATRGRWARRTDISPGETGRAGVAGVSWRVVHIVTAFAVGHSLTLALSALGWLSLPPRLVESGIALSVLVSAVHAIRPLVHRGEVLIAGGFGLLHGLAFAAILNGLDLSRTGLITTLLGFNLGIEVTQLVVVAAVMPSLLLLSRTSAYPILRNSVAALGAVLATGWLLERVGLISSNPTEPVADLLVEQPLALAAGLAAVALILTLTNRVGSAAAAAVSAPAAASVIDEVGSLDSVRTGNAQKRSVNSVS